MNFSGVSDKSVAGKFLRFPLRFIPKEMIFPILQSRARGMKWITGSSNHGCWIGSYEYEKRRDFEKIVREGSIVFDIGANVGFYSLLASVIVGQKGRVFAFEPLPRNIVYLKKHLKLNKISNVVVIEAAVANFSGMTLFEEGQDNSMGHISSQGKLGVKTVCLDELISSGQSPTPNYIKIDVEGAEMLVLSGAKSILTKTRPTLFLATHGQDIHIQCCQFLEKLGYRLSGINGESIENTDEILAVRS